MKSKSKKRSFGGNFRHFFFRGLAILLPTVLTIWILVAAYGFVRDRIATPINNLTAQLIIQATPFPHILEHEKQAHIQQMQQDRPQELARWSRLPNRDELIERDARR